MMKSRWIRWNETAVLHLDYANFKQDIEGLKAEVLEADAEILREPKGTVLVLIDLRDTVASAAVVSMFKESSKITTPYIRRHALIGVSGMKRYLADKVARLAGRPMRLFVTEKEALTGWSRASRPASTRTSSGCSKGILVRSALHLGRYARIDGVEALLHARPCKRQEAGLIRTA